MQFLLPRVISFLFTFAIALAQLFSVGFDTDILGKLYPDDFFKPSNIGALVVSPSGEQFIYTYSKVGYHNFNVVDRRTQKKRTYTGTDLKSDYINYIGWKNEFVVIFQTRFGSVYSLNLESKKRVVIFDASRALLFYNALIWGDFARPQVLSILPEDSKNVLISAFSSNGNREVYKINIDSGKRKVVQKKVKGITSWAADLNGKVRFGTRTTEKKVDFFLADLSGKSWSQLDSISFQGGDFNSSLDKDSIVSRRDYFVSFDFDPNVLYFASNRIRNTLALYRLDSVKNEIEELAYDPRYDLFDIFSGEGSLLFGKKSKSLVGVRYHRSKPSTIWFDEEFQRVQSLVDLEFPEATNLITSWDDNEEVFAFRSLRSDSPTGYYLFTKSDRRVVKIGSSNDYLEGKELVTTKVVSFAARDGLEIEGYLTMGKSVGGVPAPLVVLVHGGPWVRDQYGFDPVVQWLSYNGYSVLQLNYRGSIGYGFDHFVAASKNYGWGVQKDIQDSVAWAIENGFAEREKIGIMGASYGGYASVLAVSTMADTFQCSVAMSGIYDLLLETKNIRDSSRHELAYESWKTLVGHEKKDKAALADISPINYIDKIEKPVFVIHGEADGVAGFEHAELLVEKLKEYAVEFEFLAVPGEGHGFYQPKNQVKVYQNIIKFLNTHLPLNETESK